MLAADDWRLLIDMFTSPGCNSRSIRFFLARSLREVPRPEGFVVEHEELDMEICLVPLADLVDGIYAGQVQSPTIVAGVLALEAARLAGRLDELRPADWPVARPRGAARGCSGRSPNWAEHVRRWCRVAAGRIVPRPPHRQTRRVPHTVAGYRRDLCRYADFLAAGGCDELGAVTEADVTTFAAWLHTGDAEHAALAPSSVARALSAVKSLHRFAVDDGAAVENPAVGVSPPQS